MPRAKQSKKPVDWGPVLWALLGVSLAAGMWFSPLTAPRRIRVIGAMPGEQPAISAGLQHWASVPWARVNANLIEDEAMRSPDIKSARYEGNIFGRGVLKVIYRVPVAVVGGPVKSLLSEQGDVYLGTHNPGGLPTVVFPADSDGPTTLITTPVPTRDIAGLAKSLVASMPDINWTIQVDARSVIILLPSKGPEVVLGTSERLKEKVDKLQAILSTRPDIVRSASVINLIAPDQPVFKP